MPSIFRKSASRRGRIGFSYARGQVVVAHVEPVAGGRSRLSGFQTGSAESSAAANAWLAAWIGANRLQSLPIAAVLDRSDYELALIDAPDVEAGELRAAVRWRLRGVVEMPVEEAVIDLFEMPKRVSAATGGSLYAVAASPVAVARVTEAADVGGRLDVIDIPELALRNLVQLAAPAPKGCVALVLERRHAHAAVTALGTLYLLRRFELQRPFAAGNGVDIDVDSLMLELQRSLDYYESHFDRAPPSDMILMPRTERDHELATVLAASTSMRITVLDLNQLFEVSEPLSHEQQLAGSLAIGAALRTTQALAA